MMIDLSHLVAEELIKVLTRKTQLRQLNVNHWQAQHCFWKYPWGADFSPGKCQV